MNKYLDPRFLFFVVVGFVWLSRAWQALKVVAFAPKLDPAKNPFKLAEEPFVSIVIPAKNEEKNIRDCIDSLRAQDYPHFEIIVINDNSKDQTESILRSYGAKIQVVQAQPTPTGWTGKNYAIHSGVSKATGDWLLFSDADTRHASNCLKTALHHCQGRKLDFLSLLPRCLTGSFFEDLIQPIAMAFTGLWFPLTKINDPKSPVYFANGQYILMKKSLYKKVGGHLAVKESFLEDFALMKKAKQLKAKAECALAPKVFGTRMYDSLNGIWSGWRRIYLHAFRQNPASLMMRFFSVVVFSILPFTCVFTLLAPMKHGDPQAAFVFGLALSILVFILGVTWKGYGMIQAKKRYALLHPLGALFIAMILLDAFWMAVTRAKTTWR